MDTTQALRHFVGMDAFRQQKIDELKKITKNPDKYNPAYIQEAKKQVQQEIMEDRQVRTEKAKLEINEMKEKLSEKQFNDPYENASSTEDKLLIEMQQAKRTQLLQAEISAANSPEDFKTLLSGYGGDEHSNKLLELEIKKRSQDKNSGARYEALQVEMNQEPEGVRDLTKLEHSLTMFGNSSGHPSGLETGDITSIKYEPVLGDA